MNEIEKHLSLIGSLIISLLFPFYALYSDANLSGKVVVDSTVNHPLSGVKVSLIRIANEEILLETETDTNGSYLFTNIVSGQYKVRVEATSGYAVVSTNPLTVTIEDLPIKANFALGVSGGIMGQVTDSITSLPVSGASVEVMRGNNIVASALTDEKGYYNIDGLAPRPYIIRVRKPSFQSNLQLGIPVSNQITTIDFALQCSPGKLRGKIINFITGEPIKATINLIDRDIVIDSTQSDEDGSYLISEIAPGTYQLKIMAHKYDAIIQDFTIETNQELALDFALEPCGLVAGLVVHQMTGLPIAGASVGMWQNGALFAATYTDADGFFQLDGLKDCQIVVQALNFYDMEKGVYIATEKTSIVNFSLLWKEPIPPKKVGVKVSYKSFAHQVNRMYTIRWRESADPAVIAYRIYRNGKMIGQVSAKESFVFKDQWRSSKEKYEVTAINQFGQESLPTVADDL